MTDPAHIIDPPLPPEIAERMQSAGFSPRAETLMQIITDYRRLQAEAREKAELERTAEPRKIMWPLKVRLPLHVLYETSRRAAERGTLVATKVGGRWFVTDDDMQNWLAATARQRR
jgi:transposase InsO family protein